MKIKSYTLMETVQGKTLNELTYRKPDIVERDKSIIALQLGEYTAFSFVFGIRDGYQSNYIYDENTRILTRIDKERSFTLPSSTSDSDSSYIDYLREIAACEMSNLTYIPAFRHYETKRQVLKEFNTGFYQKFRFMKDRKLYLLDYIKKGREAGAIAQPAQNPEDYAIETDHIISGVAGLIDQDPQEVLKRLYLAKKQYDQMAARA